MTSSAAMRAVTGDDGGLVKAVDLDRGAVVATHGALDRAYEVRHLAWNRATAEAETEVLVARLTGGIDRLNIRTGQVVHHYAGFGDGGALAGVDATASGFLRTCTQLGDLVVRPLTSVDASEDATWKAGRDVLRFRANPWTENLVATGGKENDLKVWDLQGADRTVPLFQARNVKNTKLDLRVPITINDIHFLNAEGTRLVTGTAYHQCEATEHRKQVRVYDTKASRRPVLDVDVGDMPIKSIAVGHDGQTIVVGNNVGTVVLLDLRTGRTVGGVKGIAGAVQQLQMHETLPLVASVGLDRFLRVHDVTTRSLVKKVYLKHRTNAVLLGSEGPATSMLAETANGPRKRAGGDDGDVDGEDAEASASGDDVWDRLDRLAPAKRAKAGKEDKPHKDKKKEKKDKQKDKKSHA